MQITKTIFRICSIFLCLLCMAISFAQRIGNFSCNFENPSSCKWTQDKNDDFDWTRNQAYTTSQDTGPITDHSKGLGPQANKNQGPGSIQHRGGKCIHVFFGVIEEDLNRSRPKDGQFLMVHQGCGKDQLEFQLWPNGTLMLTRHGMCVKPTGPVTDGVQVGVFSSCDATDKWSWTARGSLQYKKKMCLKPETTGSIPRNNVNLILGSACDEDQNKFKFVPTSGWYLYIETSPPRQQNDKARLISPLTTKAKSCLLFFYHMHGIYVGELRVYVKFGGKMDSVLNISGNQHSQHDKWYQAQVAVNNETSSYQYVIEGVRGNGGYGDIAIDDISLMDSCPKTEMEKFSCNFEIHNSCRWTQEIKRDNFNWTRNQAYTATSLKTGPLTDHTKGSLTNKNEGPGSIQLYKTGTRTRGGNCIHVSRRNYDRPKEGEFLVLQQGCGKGTMEFQLWPNGTLMLLRFGMCVKPTGPLTDGVKVGVFSSCNATDKWSWTAQRSLQYKKKMCLKPEREDQGNNGKLVLDSVCDEPQNFFKFVPTSGWYLYIETSKPRQPNDKAQLISPSTAKAKSCLLFFYHMYGNYVGELRVYVRSEGTRKMNLVWSISGNQGDIWNQAQVAVNDRTSSYQYVIEGVCGQGIYADIAIDDISVTDSCQARDKGTTGDSSTIIIIATTAGGGVFLSIVLVVLLVIYKRRKPAPKLPTPVIIPLETNKISPESLQVDEDSVYETVADVDRAVYEDVATNANEFDYVITHERRESYAEGNLPDYEELDPDKREADNYQKLVVCTTALKGK